MSEKIGNAITDEKNTVELMTADTVIMSGGSNDVIIGGGAAGANTGDWCFLIYNNGTFYVSYGDCTNGLKRTTKISLPS